MNADSLKEYLKKEGATLVGIGNVTEALSSEILHLNRGIAIAVNRNLNRETVAMLSRLQGLTEEWLRSGGYRALVIPPDSDRQKDKLITKLYKLFCHKTAATCSGLGWVGKNGLVINRQYGSKLSWATVLTNAPLKPDDPTRESECGDCVLCVTHCPSGAIRGDHWSVSEPGKKMVAYEKCSALKNERQSLEGKPNCGFCVTVCPYSRKNGGQDNRK
ncbi:MAG: 4Fe-4S ferredoxin iron-sulfur binding protein [Nitrospirae bacterium]|nr:4Fe-4S ferredoxin iron-sulfur binding protein [Nitrospirota bacterium]